MSVYNVLEEYPFVRHAINQLIINIYKKALLIAYLIVLVYQVYSFKITMNKNIINIEIIY